MAYDFPNAPTVGQVYQSWVWDGEKWVAITSAAAAALVALVPQGRLTLQAATPVMATTQAARTAIYYTPYNGNYLPVYNGTLMVPTAFSEISVLTTDTTRNPAAIGVSKVNDWFVWNDAGTMRLSHGPDWTSDTVRSAGTALTRINGILVNAVAITNGPGISLGTYVGTTRSNASSTLDYQFGSSAAGGGTALLNVWNACNRVSVNTSVRDITASWSYASATVRMSDNSANNRISFVSGLTEEGVAAQFNEQLNIGNATSAQGSYGIALDSITAYDLRATVSSGAATGFSWASCSSVGNTYLPQLGYHFIQALESGEVGTSLFIGGMAHSLSAQLRA